MERRLVLLYGAECWCLTEGLRRMAESQPAGSLSGVTSIPLTRFQFFLSTHLLQQTLCYTACYYKLNLQLQQ